MYIMLLILIAQNFLSFQIFYVFNIHVLHLLKYNVVTYLHLLQLLDVQIKFSRDCSTSWNFATITERHIPSKQI